MSEKVPAAAEAKTWLKWAEKGYNSKYGSCPLETRIEIGRAWIELARIEADIEIAKIAASATAEVRSTDTAEVGGGGMSDDELLETYRAAVNKAMSEAHARDGFASNMSRESIVAGLRAVFDMSKGEKRAEDDVRRRRTPRSSWQMPRSRFAWETMSSPSLASLAEEFGVEVEVIRLALGSNGPHDVYAPVRYLGVSGEEAHELVEQFFERNESEHDCV